MRAFAEKTAQLLGLGTRQVEAACRLLDGEASVPFIVRYRADATGGLDERQVQAVRSAIAERDALEERRRAVLRALDKRSPPVANETLEAVRNASEIATLEDIYAPFKQARSTLAEAARAKGFGPLAERVWNGESGVDHELRRFQTDQDAQIALQHLLAERVSESSAGRSVLREIFWHHAMLNVSATPASRGGSSGAPAARGVREGRGGRRGSGGRAGAANDGARDRPDTVDRSGVDRLHGLSARARQLAPHRVLAINRGEARKLLRVTVTLPDRERAVRALCNAALPGPLKGARGGLLRDAAMDAFVRLVQPSMVRELRRRLTAESEAAAARVFGWNVRSLLLQRPVRGVAILGVDPAFRSGCKLAAVSTSGRVLEAGMVHPHGADAEARAAAERTMRGWLHRHEIGVVAIGDGTASQETVEFVAAALRGDHTLSHVRMSVVSEAGASVLSVSTCARAAEPQLDAAAIGAASIARRLQDPLAELVRVDPKAIGVGMYQHDLSVKVLDAALAEVVQSAVCHVGVDVNTASVALLTHISGLNAARAEAIVAARPEAGYSSRAELLRVRGIGPKTFEQAAGFLRLPATAAEPLDATAVHPESYAAIRTLLRQVKHPESALRDAAGRRSVADAARALARDERGCSELAAACGVGRHTLAQLIDALAAAERDAREELPGPLLLGSSLRALDQLVVGQQLEGVVRNVTPFGCFVNVGMKDDGLLHVSEMRRRQPNDAMDDPLEFAFVGQLLSVVVRSVDLSRRRLSLGLAGEESHRQKSGKEGGGESRHAHGQSSSSGAGGSSKAGLAGQPQPNAHHKRHAAPSGTDHAQPDPRSKRPRIEVVDLTQ